MLLWDVDTRDWEYDKNNETVVNAITQRAVDGAQKGSIILMHITPHSADALPGILRGLIGKGLNPVGVSELVSAGRPGIARPCVGDVCVEQGGKLRRPDKHKKFRSGHCPDENRAPRWLDSAMFDPTSDGGQVLNLPGQVRDGTPTAQAATCSLGHSV
jgi:hypothetical protein